MKSNNRKFHYFYKITNLINDKFYYGIHSTDNEPEVDKYFGSGTLLTHAIKKYGRENFKKEIIALFFSRKDAADHEKLIVDINMINNHQCYNIRSGGDNDSIEHFNDDWRRDRSINRTGVKNHFYGKCHSDYSKTLISKANKNKRPRLGAKLSKETKDKLSESHKKFQRNKPEIKLPEGMEYCFEVIEGKVKKCFRYCPECNKKLFHNCRADGVRAYNKKTSCFECSMIKSRVMLFHTNLKIIFCGIREAKNKLNITDYVLNKLLKSSVIIKLNSNENEEYLIGNSIIS